MYRQKFVFLVRMLPILPPPFHPRIFLISVTEDVLHITLICNDSKISVWIFEV